MSVDGVNITESLDELFKDDSVTQWYPKQSKTFRRINAAPKSNINAKGGLYLVETKKPQAIIADDFASSDGAEFPDGGVLAFLIMTVTPITHRAAVKISSNVEAQNQAKLKQRPASNYDYIMKSIESLNLAYGLKQSRDVVGDRVGEIARISSVNSGTATITCDTAANLFGVFLLQPGMDVEFRDGSGTLRGYARINKLDRGAKTATLEVIRTTLDAGSTIAGLGITTNDRVYMKGCYNNNWAGFAYFTQKTGAFQGRPDRSEHYRLPGMQQDMGGVTLTTGHLRRMITEKEMRCDGDEVRGEFYASTQIDAYEQTGLTTQVYGQSGDSLKQGYEVDKMRFGGRPMNRDLFFPRDVMAFLDISQVDKFEMQPFKPLKNGDSYEFMAWGSKAHKDAKLMYMRGIGNLGCGDPSALGNWYYNFSTAGLATGNA